MAYKVEMVRVTESFCLTLIESRNMDVDYLSYSQVKVPSTSWEIDLLPDDHRTRNTAAEPDDLANLIFVIDS